MRSAIARAWAGALAQKIDNLLARRAGRPLARAARRAPLGGVPISSSDGAADSFFTLGGRAVVGERSMNPRSAHARNGAVSLQSVLR
jgi:hypothetical protein